MYFDFYTFFRLLRLVVTDKDNPKRFTLQLPLMIIYLVWGMFNAFFFLLDFIFFPGFRKKPVDNPIFIIGNARSGTTFFHRLMCGDENRFISFDLWELLLPSIIQQKTVRLFFRCYGALFPKSMQKLVEWEKGLLGDIRKIRPMGLCEPDEDEFLFSFSFSSAMLTAFFPYLKELWHLSVEFEQRPLNTRRRLLNFYRSCVRRLLYVRGNQRTLLSKNPAFVGKMRDLAREFPDAKFVYLYRNPMETIPSICKLFEVTWQNVGLTEQQIERGCQVFIQGCMRDYEYALAVINELPAERCAIVDYENLVNDPGNTVATVYHQLGLSMSESYEAKLLQEGARQKRFRSANAYSLEEYGISEAQLAEKLSSVIHNFSTNKQQAAQAK